MATCRHSLSEADEIISEFGHRSAESLSALFQNGEVPIFTELRGEAVGGFLAPTESTRTWRMGLAPLAFGKRLVGWKGKRFTKPFAADHAGRGVNVFASRILPQRFGFDTIVTPALDDGKPCLRLLYDPFPSPVCGTLDELRKVADRVFLGKGYHKFPWERRYQFVTYFMLCSLQAPAQPDADRETSQCVPPTTERRAASQLH